MAYHMVVGSVVLQQEISYFFMKVSSGFPRTKFISVVIFLFTLAPRLFAKAKTEDLEIVFSGDVADYPDYRRRAKGVYAGAKTDLRELVALSSGGS